MDTNDPMIENFKKLKEKGLKAENPDQSTSMMDSFNDIIETCAWKGFCKEDTVILFQTALTEWDKRNQE